MLCKIGQPLVSVRIEVESLNNQIGAMMIFQHAIICKTRTQDVTVCSVAPMRLIRFQFDISDKRTNPSQSIFERKYMS